MTDDSSATARTQLTLAFAAVVWLLFSFVFWQRIAINTTSDLHLHIEYAERIHSLSDITSPHFLFQFAIKAIAATGLVSYEMATSILLGFCYAAMALMLLNEAQRRAPETGYLTILLGSFATLIAAHIFLFTIAQPNFYYGYLVQTAYHNPSQQLNKAFALAIWILYIRAFIEGDKPSAASGFGIAVLCVLSAIAKPSFLIAFLPLAGLVALYHILSGKRAAVVASFFYIALPIILVLAAQFLFTFGDAKSSGGLLFEPFAVVSYRYVATIPLAIAFPLLALVISQDTFGNRRNLVLAFLYLAIGLFYTVLLAEGGTRKVEGNFAWTAQTGAFLCFVEAFLLSLTQTGRRRRIMFALLAIHALFGVIYLLATAFVPAPLWL